MRTDSHAAAERIDAVVGDTLEESATWTLEETPDGYRIGLSDRTVGIERRAGPADAVHWVLTLRADDAVVSKFGPHESVAELLDTLQTVLEADVGYTVCCDADPD